MRLFCTTAYSTCAAAVSAGIGIRRSAGSTTLKVLPLPTSEAMSSRPEMTHQDALDDGEAEPGAAGFARAAAVNAIEALGQPRDVLRLDADPAIANAEHRFARRAFSSRSSLRPRPAYSARRC